MPPKQVRKQVDQRIIDLIRNGLRLKHRTIFMLISDDTAQQVANIYALLKREKSGGLQPVLWAYKEELILKKGRKSANKDENVENFVQQANLRYSYYSDTHKVLGNTFSMCVIQDFEGITPNLLARTIETVEGGGVILLLIRRLTELKQLYTLTMDVHNRYRTAKHKYVKPRFNERLLLSLAKCPTFLAIDDQLQVVPFSNITAEVELVEISRVDGFKTEAEKQLRGLVEGLTGNAIAGPLVKLAKTCDQATVITDLITTILSEDAAKCVSTVTAARGRGKSAALGIAVASAVFQGYSNIFVTSPAPENIKTFFEFVVKGLEALEYTNKDHFEVVQSTNPAYHKAVVRINVFKDHRQTVQFVSAEDSTLFNQAELLVIDEAAAIPLPLVTKMFGNHLTIMASTVNGYEGTGRSLSLKLVKTLRTRPGTTLQELQLQEPIRYAPGDSVESWLNTLLCLDSTLSSGLECPAPCTCNLYQVNRDTLFSFNPTAEKFLQQMVSLYVASHYKNQPNDLQLMSDAPAHHLFVLCAPVSTEDKKLPRIFAAVQVCEEGEVSSTEVSDSLNRGKRPSGDLIPYTVAQAFQEPSFGQLSGIRVVRIAVDPDFQRHGYGTRALQLLMQHYNGDIVYDDDDEELQEPDADPDAQEQRVSQHLLTPLNKVKLLQQPHWIGTSFGVTQALFQFWNRNGFCPIYLRHAKNDLTGEHTIVMVKSLHNNAVPPTLGENWLKTFHDDFTNRVLNLFGSVFRDMPVDLALSLMCEATLGANPLVPVRGEKKITTERSEDGELLVDGVPQLTKKFLQMRGFGANDLKRLSAFARQVIELPIVMDLVPVFAKYYFAKHLVADLDGKVGVSLDVTETCVLLCTGLQQRTLAELEKEEALGGLTTGQFQQLLLQSLRKFNTYLGKLFGTATKKTTQEQEPAVGDKRPREVEKPEAGTKPPTKKVVIKKKKK
eukprot:TRINITY_DN48402_c0_g1_i1.p1 TRINITY_DN48402_c0_g1~~TRINITY_DN48402_c0_g1_i1.p1  ORF type:complete len:949 (+),score=72.26 TRINITY_DN48402_c0_g1_i1:1-2847(+)